MSKLEKVADNDHKLGTIQYYPLTHPQKAIWYTEKLYPGTSIANIAATLRLKGDVDYLLLEKAINKFIEVNDSMRIRIVEMDGEPRQYVSEYEYRKLDFFDFSESENGLNDLYQWDEQLAHEPMKLIDSNLFYFALVKVNDNDGGFYIKTHHIISDAWTMSLVGNQIIEFYSEFKNGYEVQTDKKPSYIEFVFSEEEYKKSNRFQKDKEYWDNKFKILPEPTILKDRISNFNDTKARRKTFVVPIKLTSKIHEYCRGNKLSVFSFFLSILSIYIYRITSKTDIVLGSPILNRSNAREKDTAGMFISTVPVRINIDENSDFNTLAQQVTREWMSILRHQKYPYDLLLKDVREKHKTTENLIDISLSYQNARFNKSEHSEEYETRWHFNGTQTDSFTLNINDREDDGHLIFDYDFLSDVFHVKEIEFIHKHLLNLVHDTVQNPSKEISHLEILSEEEQHKILFEFNNTDAHYPKDKNVHQLFEEQVERTPDSIAVVFRDKQLTYRELNEKSNQLALLLRSKGVKPESIVGLMVNRSLEMMVGIMAILKAGGAYLPINPEYPEETVNHMLSDCGAKLLLTQEALMNKLQFNGKVINIEDRNIYSEDTSNLENVNKLEDLIYVIYTSGSTGTPKGVMIEHRNVVNLSAWFGRKYLSADNRNVINIAAFTFDVFVEETIVTLLNGGTVFILRKDTILDRNRFIKYMNKHNINVAQFVPALIREMLTESERIKSLNVVICGGEALDEHLKEKLISKGYNLFNHYGPTETTVDSLASKCSEDKVTLGRPIDNAKSYIVDKNLNLQPIGVAGELCVSGANVARGYLNRPEITEKRFIPNPFIHGERLYRTGDLARWYPMGEIEYLGRIDHQVKIRGHRVELYEIKLKLQEYKGVEEAVVVASPDKRGNNQIVAYIVPEIKDASSKNALEIIELEKDIGEYDEQHISIKEDSEKANTIKSKRITTSKIREYLTKKLPFYMIPSYFIFLNKIPVNSNGKIDIVALPDPDNNINLGMEYLAPRTELEEKLSRIWTENLGVERVGINDNYFELGGDSLDAVNIIAKIHKEFNVELTLKDLFETSTVKILAQKIQNSNKSEYQEIKLVENKEYYELSSAQKRMYILNEIGKTTNYNMPIAIMVKGNLNIDKLEQVFMTIIERHESFRTSFQVIDGTLLQKIEDKLSFKIEYQDKLIKNIDTDISDFIRPFQLNEAPLLRVKVIRKSENESIMLIDMHHIISDGVSLSILFDELIKLYKGEKLEDLKLQYKDFANWENRKIQSGGLIRQKEYWSEVFKDDIPVLDMPLDFKRPEKQTFNGEVLEFKISKKDIEKLKRIGKNINLNFIIFALYAILLNKYTNQDDFIIGSITAGRNHADINQMVGNFINFLPIRSKINTEESFIKTLEAYTQNMISVYQNQEYPFEKMIHDIDINFDRTRNPLFDTAIVFHNELESDILNKKIEVQDDLTFENYKIKRQNSAIDFKLDVFIQKDGLNCLLEYNTDIYKRTTMQRFVKHFNKLIKEVAENPNKKIAEIEILTEEEKNKILYEFNDTKADYPKDKTIHQLFEEQAGRTPDNIAVVFEDSHLTYRELNEKANQLARLLREKGVKPDGIVGIMVYRSLEMIIGVMGILKAGGAYLPIDPEYPEDRIQYMLEDSNAKVLLTETSLREKIKFNGEIIDLKGNYSGDESNLKNSNKPNDLAYVIYTSGSTGKPKGVMIEHYSVINRINWMHKKYPINENSVIHQKTPFTFDVSVWELFWWSFVGARVCMLKPGGEKNPEEIISAIEKNKITTMHFVPSMLNMFLYYLEEQADTTRLSSLKQIFASGEALNIQQVTKFNSLLNEINGTELYNLYGPTEATVDVSYFDCSPLKELNAVPIGKPIDNISLYILDQNNKLVPIGIPGELCIGGDGVARGYINKPELTAEKFISNPFIAGGKMYKTGDLARWLPNGDIEYLGRMDFQVKIRGNRIELGEIENRLLQHEKVKNTVVVVREDKGNNKYLCAYVVCSKDTDVSELRAHLQKELPDYMMPTYFIKLEKLPLTSSGKVNRKALPEPDEEIRPGTEYLAPRNEIERTLAMVWSEVLQIEKIGIDDNFFALGGDSLTIIGVLVKVSKYNWGLIMQDFYKYQTIRELSNKIRGVVNDDSCSELLHIATIEVKEEVTNISEEAQIDNVFLTGATGFLGIHILNDLIEDTKANIYCLVRGENKTSAENRLIKLLKFYFEGKYCNLIGKRIFVLNGDVTLEKFGLSKEEYDELGNNVDTVIHTAAIVKYFGDYSEIENVNVFGTKRVVDFALKYKKKLNHISTVGISGSYLVDSNVKNITLTENDFYVGQNYVDNVYVRSKFEAENLIHKAIQQGLNAVIYRMGNLTGRYSDGHFQQNISENAFYRATKSIIQIGAVPEELLEEEIEITPVDFASRAVLKVLKTKESIGRIFHIFDHNEIKMKRLVEILREIGIDIKALNNEKFKEHLEHIANDESRQNELDGIIYDISETTGLSYTVAIDVDSNISRRYLMKLGFDWPIINEEYIIKLVTYMRTVKFLLN